MMATILRKSHVLIQRRYLMTLFGFLSAVVTHSQRINLSFAMVDMVNATNVPSIIGSNNKTECPSFRNEEGIEKTHHKGEFDWNAELQGYILSAGFAGFLITQIPGGILVSRFGSKPIMLTSLICGSVCNLISPVSARLDPYLFLAIQLIRGLAQGIIAAPLTILASRWFPVCERGFLSPFIYMGFPIGAVIGSSVSGPLCEVELDNGWPLVFYVFGSFGLVVSILIGVFYVERPADDKNISEQELQLYGKNSCVSEPVQRTVIPWLSILKTTSIYALFIALFAQYWMMPYFLASHPLYMSHILNIPVKENGLLTSGPQLAQALAGFGSCWLSLWMTRKLSVNANLLRKGCHILSCSIFSLGMMGMYFAGCDTVWHAVCLFIAAGAPGLNFAGCLIIAVDMSPTFCGVLTGLATTIGSLAGFIVPVIVGALTKEEQSMAQWHKMFLITGAVTILSSVIFTAFGSATIQPYDPAYQSRVKATDETELKINDKSSKDPAVSFIGQRDQKT